ncbi:MAG: phenylacetate-CoA oxygenase subunit PaaJ, partial [Pseudarthrobacter sp.]|nr:phenylacetate-CoA oxygenase subunit PaaJ [Pseudarthrobacter sp.]
MTVMATQVDQRQAAWDIAATVCDPEIPVLTIADLGILRDVQVGEDDQQVRVTITPTYSGCPAMDAIRDDLKTAFAKEGYAGVDVDLVLAPAWTTDWMTDA